MAALEIVGDDVWWDVLLVGRRQQIPGHVLSQADEVLHDLRGRREAVKILKPATSFVLSIAVITLARPADDAVCSHSTDDAGEMSAAA
eukprot:CAMPEP_0171690944 /NCGR_PEP_ID=MMETSP0991-20121206/5264_1 /TAXON_ID=483369 /ORGANISM="non described non described, Strain CCMP2098" /LENGTH=87 /DNA_ID=CAMNT_0012279117 /DNA_START=452 /DNA_END=716 /DNA_ORIENTATION=+